MGYWSTNAIAVFDRVYEIIEEPEQLEEPSRRMRSSKERDGHRNSGRDDRHKDHKGKVDRDREASRQDDR